VWGVWSTKARGGYAELLCLGQALLLVTLLLAQSPSRRLALLWGILAGLAFWTHLLAIVYLLPAAIYLILGRRSKTGQPLSTEGARGASSQRAAPVSAPQTATGGTAQRTAASESLPQTAASESAPQTAAS